MTDKKQENEIDYKAFNNRLVDSDRVLDQNTGHARVAAAYISEAGYADENGTLRFKTEGLNLENIAKRVYSGLFDQVHKIQFGNNNEAIAAMASKIDAFGSNLAEVIMDAYMPNTTLKTLADSLEKASDKYGRIELKDVQGLGQRPLGMQDQTVLSKTIKKVVGEKPEDLVKAIKALKEEYFKKMSSKELSELVKHKNPQDLMQTYMELLYRAREESRKTF